MNTFYVVFLCIQACLVKSIFGQYTSRAAVAAEPGLIAPGLTAPYALGSPFAYNGLPSWGGIAPAASPFGALSPYGIPEAITGPLGYRAGFPELAFAASAGIAPYGGIGEGNVAVAGELPVVGNTAVFGQVPIMGAVNFGGTVPSAGSVSISGQCACDCGAPYLY